MEGDLRYHPDAEQLALAGAFNETIAALLPLSRLRERRQDTARNFSELEASGLFGLSRSEEQGGSGLGAAEEALILTGLGKHLPSPGIVATLGACHAASVAMTTAEGRTVRAAAAYRRGDRIIVVDGRDADLILLRDAGGAGLFEPAPAAAVVDDQHWLSELAEAAGLGKQIARFEPRMLLRLRLIDAAILAGIAEGALAMAVEYAAMREQFGRPIGTFQAVKHHCANMAIAARCARDQVSFAAVAADQARDDAKLQIESAFLVAGNAAIANAGKAIQIHGGIGFSDEADPHLFLKRAQIFIAIAGGLEAAAERVAAI